MLPLRCLLAATLAAAACVAPASASPARVQPSDLHLDHLHPATLSYLVHWHGAPGEGIERTMLATTRVARERVDGADAWVIEQDWEDGSGRVHTARTVHAADDMRTLAQTSTWNRPTGRYTSTVIPGSGQGRIEGQLPQEARRQMEAGFAAMRDGWWMNWHSDLTLLPLLPYEKGGTLRIRLFDVGMAAPADVDYTVLGERTLQGADGTRYDCWLVQTQGTHPGDDNYQRFWIDKARRLVVKEEDVYEGRYRSKVLLAVPATTEFQAGRAPAAATPR